MDISSLSFYQNEKESLLAPGTQLKVIKRERKGKVTEVGLFLIDWLLSWFNIASCLTLPTTCVIHNRFT